MTTICDVANKLPNLIGALLDSESVLKRGRFREETLTDLFTGSLAAFAGPDLVIQYPPEAMTGGIWISTSGMFQQAIGSGSAYRQSGSMPTSTTAGR